jgi:hypothetical protein
MFDLAQSLLDQRDLTGALDIVKQIPVQAKLQREVEDFEVLANAQSRAWSGSEGDIESAIAEAQRIVAGRPLHSKAQKLIARWQSERQDVAQLNQARQFAQSGRPEDLQNAIAAASKISGSSARSQEAQKFIDEINRDLQSKQDRPILERAEQIASGGDLASLRGAIQEINKISSGRALAVEAQRRRDEWSGRIRDIEARERDLNRPLQPTSPSPFGSPTDPSPPGGDGADLSLQDAQQAASGGTIDDYARAINLANGVPANSPRRSEADQYINQLSLQMLQAAVSQSSYDMQGAIASAQKIPPGSQGYNQAQVQIQVWRRTLGL